jgi:hypothetical protein
VVLLGFAVDGVGIRFFDEARQQAESGTPFERGLLQRHRAVLLSRRWHIPSAICVTVLSAGLVVGREPKHARSQRGHVRP